MTTSATMSARLNLITRFCADDRLSATVTARL
jgi:hypothetical protein